MSESVTLHVDSLYAKAVEAVKSRADLSASSPDSILIWNDIISEARLWNRPQSVNFSFGSERFLILTWSSMWNTIGRWSESKISETITSDTDIFVNHNIQHVTISRRGKIRKHEGSLLSHGTTEMSHSCNTFQSSFLLCSFLVFWQKLWSSSLSFFFYWNLRSATGNSSSLTMPSLIGCFASESLY
jgi:hypothetical protein